MSSPSEGLSRRKFLGALGAGLAAGVVGEGVRQHRQNETVPVPNESLIRVLNESQREKIDFKLTERVERTPELLAALQQLVQLQVARMKNYGMALGDKSSASLEVLSRSMDQQQHAELQQETWETLKQVLGDVGDYTEEGYIKALAYDLPRALAKYGIFAKGLRLANGSMETDRLTVKDVIYRFYEVETVLSDTLERWGKTVTRDVTYISGVISQVDQQELDPSFAKAEAQTMFGNVMVYNELFQRLGKNILEQQDKGELDLYAKLTPALVLQAMEGQVDNKVLRAQGLQALILQRFATQQIQTWDFKNHILEHETGHLIEQADPDFAAYYTPSDTDKLSEYNVETFEHQAKDEIAAIIHELRYTPNKLPSLNYAAQWYENTLDGDYPHAKSAHWVLDQIVATILKQADYAGLKMNAASSCSPETQIMIQLALFVDDPKFLEIMDMVKATFEATYATESFKAEIEETFGLRAPTGVREFVCTTAIVGGVALGAMALLNKKTGE